MVAGGCVVGALDWGAVGWGAVERGFGVVGAWTGLENFSRIELPWLVALSVRRTRAMAQIMNITAHHVVA